VGFPGESDADFEATRDLMRRIRYDGAFVFKYSPRPGARSAQWEDDVSEEEKARRITALIEEQKAVSLERNADLVGSEVLVLAEGPSRKSPEHWFGKTEQFKTAVFRHGDERVGDSLRMRVAAASPYTLFGEGVSSAVRTSVDVVP
jgi:tRNA-2-methylthio-N6-dimethylallyladenosine synthase